MRTKAFIILLLLVFFSFEVNAQCAMCRAVLESEADQSAAKGINDGIMYLMVFPYLLMGGVAYMVWRSRKKDKQTDPDQPQ
jgi:heme/copper-type cytochrome/quinol oxidase subunit 2